VHVLSGNFQGHKGAFEGRYVRACYLDIELPAHHEWSLDTDPQDTLFVYIFSGKVNFDPQSPQWIDAKQAVLFSPGEKFWTQAANQDVRMILLSARALREPIAWGGPIVMNTVDELNLAFRELDEHTFIKAAGGFGGSF